MHSKIESVQPTYTTNILYFIVFVKYYKDMWSNQYHTLVSFEAEKILKPFLLKRA